MVEEMPTRQKEPGQCGALEAREERAASRRASPATPVLPIGELAEG